MHNNNTDDNATDNTADNADARTMTIPCSFFLKIANLEIQISVITTAQPPQTQLGLYQNKDVKHTSNERMEDWDNKIKISAL